MVDLEKGYETIIFAWQGKPMIGKIFVSDKVPVNDTSEGSVIGTLLGDTAKSDYYIIHNPCEIEYNIEVPAQGAASLDWKLKPFYYKYLIADDGVSYSPFAFKKDTVAVSNIGGTTINSNLLAAYKEIVGV